jgi:hypothetical protein
MNALDRRSTRDPHIYNRKSASRNGRYKKLGSVKGLGHACITSTSVAGFVKPTFSGVDDSDDPRKTLLLC